MKSLGSVFVGQSDEIQQKKSDPKDFIGFRNPDSGRISLDGRIRPDPIEPGIGFMDLGKSYTELMKIIRMNIFGTIRWNKIITAFYASDERILLAIGDV